MKILQSTLQYIANNINNSMNISLVNKLLIAYSKLLSMITLKNLVIFFLLVHCQFFFMKLLQIYKSPVHCFGIILIIQAAHQHINIVVSTHFFWIHSLLLMLQKCHIVYVTLESLSYLKIKKVHIISVVSKKDSNDQQHNILLQWICLFFISQLIQFLFLT